MLSSPLKIIKRENGTLDNPKMSEDTKKTLRSYELGEKERLKIIANLIIDHILYDYQITRLKKSAQTNTL